MVAVDGAITEWAAGDVRTRDLEVRLPLDVARRYYRGEADGTETLAACTVVEPGRRGGPPVPRSTSRSGPSSPSCRTNPTPRS